jgi:hypothetical protein
VLIRSSNRLFDRSERESYFLLACDLLVAFNWRFITYVWGSLNVCPLCVSLLPTLWGGESPCQCIQQDWVSYLCTWLIILLIRLQCWWVWQRNRCRGHWLQIDWFHNNCVDSPNRFSYLLEGSHSLISSQHSVFPWWLIDDLWRDDICSCFRVVWEK